MDAKAQMTAIMEKQSAWAASWNSKINAMIADCQRLIAAITELQRVQGMGGTQGFNEDAQYGTAITSYVAKLKAEHPDWDNKKIEADEGLQALYNELQAKVATGEYAKWDNGKSLGQLVGEVKGGSAAANMTLGKN
jgi:hypothetical protein